MNPTEPSFAQSQQIDALPTPNLPLLRKVLDQIDAEPLRYDQRCYATETDCGTAYCIAGWAAHLSGYDVDPRDTAAVVGPDGVSRQTEEVARELLGITDDEAWFSGLFAQNSGRARVQSVAEQIAARAGERL